VLPSDNHHLHRNRHRAGRDLRSGSVTVTVARIDVALPSDPPVIVLANLANLTWTTKGALSLSMITVSAPFSPCLRSTAVSPTTTTTYTATANGTNSQV